MEDENIVYLLLKNIDNKFYDIIELFSNNDNNDNNDHNFDDIFKIFEDIVIIMGNNDYHYDNSIKHNIIEIFVSMSIKIDNIIDLFEATCFDSNNNRRLSNFINIYNDFEKKLNIIENDLTVLY